MRYVRPRVVFVFVASCASIDRSRHRLDGNEDRLPLISVAAVDGAAIGGGAELCTSCDFRVAGPESSIRFVQVKVQQYRPVRYPYDPQSRTTTSACASSTPTSHRHHQRHDHHPPGRGPTSITSNCAMRPVVVVAGCLLTCKYLERFGCSWTEIFGAKVRR